MGPTRVRVIREDDAKLPQFEKPPPLAPPADQRLKSERGGGDAGFIEGPIFSFRCGCGAAAP